MPNTRRGFLQSAPVLAAAVSAATNNVAGQARQELPPLPARGGQARPGRGVLASAVPPRPVSEVQVPKMKFGGVEISRLVLGCNPFGGEAHYNANFRAFMREYFTEDRVCAVMHQCNRFGINAFNATGRARFLQRFEAEGGKMHFIAQGGQTPLEEEVKTLKPLALYNMGEVVDRAFQTDTMDDIREWCKRARDLGVVVGVGTHKPEVIALVEEQNWDVDFYAGCVYNRTRTDDEWRQVLKGEIMEMSREIYLQSDPPRMYKVMRQTSKPCFAFKVLAAGRIPDAGVEQAFRTAFESLKPIDGVFVGVCPHIKDEVREDAEIVHKILVGT
ncbi:MAG: hypothetical protein ABSH56_05705 [Bryobacteraceae bacterium]